MAIKQILCFTLLLFLLPSLGFTKVATSFSILSLMVKEIAPSEIEIHTLAFTGEDAHHLELTPKTLLFLKSQDLLLFNGLGFEHSLQQLKNKPSLNLRWIEVAKGVRTITTSHKEVDPHAWHDPDNLLIYLENITAALETQYPQKKSLFRFRFQRIKDKIKNWQKETQLLFQKKKQYLREKKQTESLLIVTAHGGFQYLTQAFGLQSLALLGNHEHENLTARELTQKIQELKKTPQRVFFGEGGEQDVYLQEWAKKTTSPWGGVLWGDSIKASTLKSLTLLEYLDHNTKTLLRAFP